MIFSVLKNRGKAWKRTRSAAWVGIASCTLAGLSGCYSPSALTPVESADGAEVMGDSVEIERQGVTVQVDAGAWEGRSEVRRHVTPLRVEIVNRSDRPVRLGYGDFSLEQSADGTRFSALPPYAVTGSISEQRVARSDFGLSPIGFAHDRFAVSPFYEEVYPGLSPWGHPFHHDPYYHDHYVRYWENTPLPTERMVAWALPEGVIEPGGQVSGFLYFERVPNDVDQVSFHYELINAENGERFGVARAPFRVEG